MSAIDDTKFIGDIAARTGFDWDSPLHVIDKIKEELEELVVEINTNHVVNIQDELGDVLFTVMQLSRSLGIDPELALSQANVKFINRFEHMQKTALQQGKRFASLTMDEQMVLWHNAKRNMDVDL